MTPFAIAGVQMHITPHNNIAAMGHRLDLLMHLYPWVQMVLFSELAPYGPLLHHAQPLPGSAEEAFQEMAAKHRVWLVNGSMYERREGAIYNTASVIDPEGKVAGRYRKIFPFRPLEQGVEGGRDFLVFDVPNIGRFGVLTCYDLWFPETARQLTSMGVEVILHPVLTHTIDRDVDINVAQATAAMFQCYVVSVNGLGAGGNGQSCIVDPGGRFLYKADVLEQLMPVEIDLDQVRRQRQFGFRGLGQMLKSFRDRPADFPVYDRARFDPAYLDSLGPLVQPTRDGAVPIPGPEKPAAARPKLVG
ncbi:MAG: carbon-nitrogen hydrolase family protein [Dongiaceae bacterium]